MFPLPQNSKSARGRLAHELTSKPTPSIPKSANIPAAPPLTTAGPTESPVPNHHTGTGTRTVRSWTNDALRKHPRGGGVVITLQRNPTNGLHEVPVTYYSAWENCLEVLDDRMNG